MRNRIIAALAGLALILGVGLASTPAVATSPESGPAAVAFDAANPPPRYSPAEEKQHTLKGVKGLPKGKIVNGKGYNPNAKLLTGPYYFYAGAWQILAAGESANLYASNLHVDLPYLDTTNDSHTLGENALQSHNQQQTIEAGWTHDSGVCGAGNSPCMFVGSWKNGAFLGYNTGFVEWADSCSPAPPTVAWKCPGDTLPTGTQKRFQWLFSGGVWWLAYDLKWIGYFPHSIWTNAPGSVTFDKGGVFNTFYEIATKTTGDTTPCTDMAGGRLGTDAVGPWSTSGTNSLGGTLPGAIANNFSGYNTDGVGYDHNTVSAQTTRAGGPGYNSAGTGVGTRGSC